MKTFTVREAQLIDKLKELPPHATLELTDPCRNHSNCIPLPLFRVYRVSDAVFEAEWNDHHKRGPKQSFLFGDTTG